MAVVGGMTEKTCNGETALQAVEKMKGLIEPAIELHTRAQTTTKTGKT